jgi:soluble lytic murein transglycosylase
MRITASLLSILLALPLAAKDDATRRKPHEADEEIITGSLPKNTRIKPEISAQSGVFTANDQAQITKVIDKSDPASMSFSDQAARTLAEMLYLKGNEPEPTRAMSFLSSHPNYPGSNAIKRKLEPRLSASSPYFKQFSPVTAKGKALKAIATNDAVKAKEVFTSLDLTADTENDLTRAFASLNSRENRRARMDKLLELGDYASALRSANRLGEGEASLVKLRAAFDDNKAPPRSYFNAVPTSHQQDPHYLLAKAQLSRRADEPEAAAPSLLSSRGKDADHWIERRMIARKLLDEDNAKLAYKVAASHHGTGSDQLDADFYAGFIALRYLNDAQTALRHFDRAARAANTPASQSRGAYWLARAYDQAGNKAYAKQSYAYAARFSTFYYGQLSAAKLGQPLSLKQAPVSGLSRDAFMRLAGVRAIATLYDMDETEQARSLVVEMAYSLQTGEQLTLLGEIARKAEDAKGELLIGKLAAQRGFAADITSYPLTGIPPYKAVTGSAEKALVYSIARQESTFDPRAVSGAGAMGLMQMLPATASKTASRFGLAFEKSRLTSDAAFNAQLGAAHLGELMGDYGSYILTAVAYNAGPKRVGEWIEKYGDPRKSGVDAVDFVERIPFSETRHYVQKVLENLQVYKMRFGGQSSIEADLKRGRG